MTGTLTRRRFLAGAMGLPVALAGAAPVPAVPAVQAAGTVHEVTIERFRFRPARLVVRPGDRVRWINRDLSPHTATALNGAWDTGELKQGEHREIMVTGGMEGPYLCAFHPAMRGRLAFA